MIKVLVVVVGYPQLVEDFMVFRLYLFQTFPMLDGLAKKTLTVIKSGQIVVCIGILW